MDGFVLSIDQGTTGTTALVFDRDCRVRGRGYSEFTQHYPRPGWVEHDPEEIWNVSMGAVADALGAAGVEARDLRAVGIANQRETVVAWDRATSLPVRRRIASSQPSSRRRSQTPAVLRSCHTIAGWTARRVSLRHSTVVSRWLAIPIAASDRADVAATARASPAAASMARHQWSGSCSTQPGRG